MVGPGDSIEDHRRTIAVAIDDLRAISELAGRLGLEAVVRRTADVLRRVESDVFRIAVVGEFKRGKSTLINALMGREILPADVLPCSATVNRVTYGLTPSVTLVFRPTEPGGEPREEVIGIDELSAYVTKLTPESEKRAADIQEAIVRYPVPFCRDKAEIIDTPGLNDDEAMTAVTLGVLPSVDAALLVILAQSPFSSYEADFLNRLLTNDLGRVLFVVNRLDEIRRPADRQRILQVVTDRIRKAIEARAAELYGDGTDEARAFLARVGEPKVFGVSGGLALDARIAGDEQMLAESGFPVFERALEGVLTRERGGLTLSVVREAAASGAAAVLHQVRVAEGALAMKAEEFEVAYARTTDKLAELEAQHAAEIAALDQAQAELRAIVAPRARELPDRLAAAAIEVVSNYPLTAAAVDKSQVDATVARITKALTERLQAVARLHAEQVQLEIERAVEQQLVRLRGFAAAVAERLREIEVDFRLSSGDAPSSDLVGDGAATAAGFATNVLTGGLVGGFVSGAFAGYRAAGLKGAAVGSATGVAVSTGTILTVATAAGIIGLPLTWPVVLPILAVGGLASALVSRRLVQFVFGSNATDGFRSQLEAQVLQQLEASSAERVAALTRAIEQQIDDTFGAVRGHVEVELGAPLVATRTNLDQLRVQLARTTAERERDGATWRDAAARAEPILSRCSTEVP
ncbi:MAG: dynamin family protein [Myxococcota bacterium]